MKDEVKELKDLVDAMFKLTRTTSESVEMLIVDNSALAEKVSQLESDLYALQLKNMKVEEEQIKDTKNLE